MFSRLVTLSLPDPGALPHGRAYTSRLTVAAIARPGARLMNDACHLGRVAWNESAGRQKAASSPRDRARAMFKNRTGRIPPKLSSSPSVRSL